LSKLNNETEGGASDPMAITDRYHIAAIMNMINAVINNKAPKVTIDQAKKSVELINYIYKSNGNCIKLNKI